MFYVKYIFISIVFDFLKYYYLIVLMNFKNNKFFKYLKNYFYEVNRIRMICIFFCIFMYWLYCLSRCLEGDVFKIRKMVFVFWLIRLEVIFFLEIIIFVF